MAVPQRRDSVVAIRLVQVDGLSVDYPVRDGDIESAALAAVHAWREGDSLHIGGAGWSRRVFPPPWRPDERPRLELVPDLLPCDERSDPMTHVYSHEEQSPCAG
jgi:hypothetical protein